jgi:hypothetical protein
MTDADIEMIQSMTFCSREEAETALMQYGGVLNAIASLYPLKETAAKKRIPIDTGMDAEQIDRCKRGRDLQDKINAVFSVAHPQVKSSQSAELEQMTEAVPVEIEMMPVEKSKTE